MNDRFMKAMREALGARGERVETVAPVRCPYCDKIYNDEGHPDSCPMNH